MAVRPKKSYSEIERVAMTYVLFRSEILEKRSNTCSLRQERFRQECNAKGASQPVIAVGDHEESFFVANL